MSETVIIYLFFTLSFIPWASSSGLSLKLIHRDSPLSPLYQPNLSDSERLMININISEARASYFQQLSTEVKDALRLLPVKFYDPVFTVDIRLGTPAMKRTLIFDTGSGLTWTNCEPCPKCFKQKDPLFNPKASSSYRLINRTHHLARSFRCSSFFGGCCNAVRCLYNENYYSGRGTAGVAATDTLTFLTKDRIPGSRLYNFAFGCGKSTSGQFIPQVSGILGLDSSPRSLARQLWGVDKDRFSYCLSSSPSKASYLRFGDEAVIRGSRVQRTPLKTSARRPYLYLVVLNDLSIDGKKLGLQLSGGCIVDSGSPVSQLNKRAFAAATKGLDEYFARIGNVKKYVGKNAPKGMPCYTKTNGSINIINPKLRFHFHGAHLDVNRAMYVTRTLFCMPFRETKDTTILGAYHQINVRMVFELDKMMLSFDDENCDI